MRGKSPVAHRAVAQSLSVISYVSPASIPDERSPAFDFIAGPIQRLFRDHPPTLNSILKVLNVLAVRFRRSFVHKSAHEVSWVEEFDTSVPFMDSLLASLSPADFARSVYTTDEQDFAALSLQSITTHDGIVRQILSRWSELSMQAWECCMALPELTEYILECAQVNLSRHSSFF